MPRTYGRRSSARRGRVYGGSKSYAGRKALRSKDAVAPARRGEKLQSITALRYFLHKETPHTFPPDNNPYIPFVSSTKHLAKGKMVLAPVDETKLTNVLPIILNGPLDPTDAGTGGPQSTGADVMEAQYAHWIVTKAEWKMTIRNFYVHSRANEPGDGVFFFANTSINASAPAPTYDDIVETKLAQKWAGGSGGYKTDNDNYRMVRLPQAKFDNTGANITNDQYLDPGVKTISGVFDQTKFPVDDLSSATGHLMKHWLGTSETKQPNPVHLYVGALMKGVNFETSSMDNPIRVDWEIIYHVTWFEPKQPGVAPMDISAQVALSS